MILYGVYNTDTYFTELHKRILLYYHLRGLKYISVSLCYMKLYDGLLRLITTYSPLKISSVTFIILYSGHKRIQAHWIFSMIFIKIMVFCVLSFYINIFSSNFFRLQYKHKFKLDQTDST